MLGELEQGLGPRELGLRREHPKVEPGAGEHDFVSRALQVLLPSEKLLFRRPGVTASSTQRGSSTATPIESEDLFYRLNVVKLELPPLRERPGDIELLAQNFVSEFSKKVKRPVSGISEQVLALLKRHDWPGNIRELSNTIERAVVLGATELISSWRSAPMNGWGIQGL